MNDPQSFAFPSRRALLLTVPHAPVVPALPPARQRATLLNFPTLPKTKDTTFEEENFASEQSLFRASGFAGNNVN